MTSTPLSGAFVDGYSTAGGADSYLLSFNTFVLIDTDIGSWINDIYNNSIREVAT